MEIWIVGVAPRSGFFQTHFFLRVFEKLEPGKGGHFQNPFLPKFEKWDPGIVPKSKISKISCSSHSENAHIKLNGFQSWFGGWGGPAFIYFMGWNGQKSENGPPELFIHLGGVLDKRAKSYSSRLLGKGTAPTSVSLEVLRTATLQDSKVSRIPMWPPRVDSSKGCLLAHQGR